MAVMVCFFPREPLHMNSNTYWASYNGFPFIFNHQSNLWVLSFFFSLLSSKITLGACEDTPLCTLGDHQPASPVEISPRKFPVLRVQKALASLLVTPVHIFLLFLFPYLCLLCDTAIHRNPWIKSRKSEAAATQRLCWRGTFFIICSCSIQRKHLSGLFSMP